MSEWLQCNRCRSNTQHELLLTRTVTENVVDDAGWEYSWRNSYGVLECRGCGTLTLRDSYTDQDEREEVRFFPARLTRTAPVWRFRLPDDFGEVLEEIYVAVQNGARRLAAMGVRALLDMVAQREVGDVGGFGAKLSALESRGLLTTHQKEILRVALDAGSAAAHRGFSPDPATLNTVLDIAEHLLQSLYHLPTAARGIESVIPPRNRVH